MRIVIAGCGRVGSDLAIGLAEDGHDVSVVDHRDGVFRDLGTTFNGTTHHGVAYDIEVLREAGIEFADSFVAVTNSDNANLMSVQIAKQVFGVPHTIARLDDPAQSRLVPSPRHPLRGGRQAHVESHPRAVDRRGVSLPRDLLSG